MRKSVFLVAAVGLAAVLVAGGLFASNMGFKLNYLLEGPGTTATGTNSFSYPYHSTLTLAGELITEINAVGGGAVASVSAWDKNSDGLIFYTGFSGTNFALIPGEGYLVAVGGDVTGYLPSHY